MGNIKPEDRVFSTGNIPKGMYNGLGIFSKTKFAGPVIIFSPVINFSFLALIKK